MVDHTPSTDLEAIQRLIGTEAFQAKYPILTGMLHSVVEDIKLNNKVLETPTLQNNNAQHEAKEIPQELNVDKASKVNMSETSGKGVLRPEKQDIPYSSPTLKDTSVQVNFALESPQENKTAVSIPGYYMKRLLDIQNSYAAVMKKRHTVKYFHDTLRETARRQAGCVQQDAYRISSRLSRYVDIHRPTGSLCELENTDVQHTVGHVIDPHLNIAGGGTKPPTALEKVLNRPKDLRDHLEENGVIVKGVQKLPKPNPIWLFQKNGFDLSVGHLVEMAKRLRSEIQEIERRWKKVQCEENLKELDNVGVNSQLMELYKTQQYLSLEQQREKESICQEGTLCTSEIDTVLRRTRKGYYSQLYAIREDPEKLTDMKKQMIDVCSNVEEIFALQDRGLSGSSPSVALNRMRDGGHFFTIKPQVSKNGPTPAQKLLVLKDAGYSSEPVPVKRYNNLKSHFPKVFPNTLYPGTYIYQLGPTVRELKKQSKTSSSLSVGDNLHRHKMSDIQGLLARKKKIDEDGLEYFMNLLHDKRSIENNYIGLPNIKEQAKTATDVLKKQDEFPNINIRLPTEKEPEVFNVDDVYKNSGVESIKVDRNQKGDTGTPNLLEKKLSITEDTKKLIKRLREKPFKCDKEQARITTSNLALRVPRRACPRFVDMGEDSGTQSLSTLYNKLRHNFDRNRLGLPDTAVLLFHFAEQCVKTSELSAAHARAYSEILLNGIVYYPLQLDLLCRGVNALFHIYEVYPDTEELLQPYVDFLTTLLAVEDLPFQKRLIEGLSIIINSYQCVNLSTDFVDFLINLLSRFDSPELAQQGLKILCLACVGHKKADQYALFLQCLEKWKRESAVLVRACLAIDAFSQRASTEYSRLQDRQKKAVSKSKGAYAQRETKFERLSSRTVPWMPRDGSEIRQIVAIIILFPEHRKLLGAAYTALASLTRLSKLHARTTANQNWSPLLKICRAHTSSQCIALSAAQLIQSVAYCEPKSRFIMSDASIHLLIDFIDNHLDNPTIIAESCLALSSLDQHQLAISSSRFTSPFLAALVNAVHENVSNPLLALGFVSLLRVFSQTQENALALRIANQNPLPNLIQMMQYHKKDEEIAYSVCKCCTSLLTYSAGVCRDIEKLNLIDHLTDVLEAQPTHDDVVLAVIETLRCYLSSHSEGFRKITEEHIKLVQRIKVSNLLKENTQETLEMYLKYINQVNNKLLCANEVDIFLSDTKGALLFKKDRTIIHQLLTSKHTTDAQ